MTAPTNLRKDSDDAPELRDERAPESRPVAANVAAPPAVGWVSGDGDGPPPGRLAPRQPGTQNAVTDHETPSTGTAVATAGPRSGLRVATDFIRTLRTFDSLQSRSFRWYFVSMFGNFGAMNMQMLVKGFLVFQLTGSYTALASLGLANAIPGLLLSLPGGVVADRLPKKLIQQVGGTLNALNSLSIAILLVAGMLRWEYLLANAAIQGVIQGLMMPARQSWLSDLVYPRQIMNAVALNNAGMGLSRMVMPTLGGIMLAVTDSYWVFFVITACYAFSVVTLAKVPAEPIEIPPEERLFSATSMGRGQGFAGRGGGHGAKGVGGVRDLVDGLRYIAEDRTIALLLLVNFLMVLFSMPYMQFLPGFVKQVLDGGASMQGVLMSISSIGSLAAALVVASLPSHYRGKVLIIGGLVLGLALTAFSFSNVFWLTAVVMVFIGVGQSVRMALSNALVQTYVSDEYRGRVMSIYMMEMNLVQIGTFGVGLMAQAMGIQWALGLTSMSLVVLSLVAYAFMPRLRNID